MGAAFVAATAGLTVSLGVSFATKGKRHAKMMLLAMDSGWLDFYFQFPPTNFTRNIGAEYAEAQSLNMEEPIQQWTKGKLKTITFDAMFFAQHAAHDVDDYVEYFERMVAKDEKLGRPPIWNFVYGKVVDQVVLIESIGGVKYGELRTEANVGTIRDVHFSISLRKYTPYDITLTDPNALPSDTFYVLAKDGDTWEHLAARHYGNAKYGDILRQKHPEQPILQAGFMATLPEFENIRSEAIEPSSIPLERTVVKNAAKAVIFEERNISKYSRIIRT